jgi:hypothetical protein
VEKPALAVLQRGRHRRPPLPPEQRAELLPYFKQDNALLSELTGVDHSDWQNPTGRGAFTERT